MKANYGYKDGSGEYFITIDTDCCIGCEACVPACPSEVFAVVEDEFSLDDERVAIVVDTQRNRLKDACAACKPTGQRLPLPCAAACEPDAIEHSW